MDTDVRKRFLSKFRDLYLFTIVSRTQMCSSETVMFCILSQRKQLVIYLLNYLIKEGLFRQVSLLHFAQLTLNSLVFEITRHGPQVHGANRLMTVLIKHRINVCTEWVTWQYSTSEHGGLFVPAQSFILNASVSKRLNPNPNSWAKTIHKDFYH